jgi:hypothetical protein
MEVIRHSQNKKIGMTNENLMILADHLIENELEKFKRKCFVVFLRILYDVNSMNKNLTISQTMSFVINRARYEMKYSGNAAIFFDIAFEESFELFVDEGYFNKETELHEETDYVDNKSENDPF